MLYGVPSYLVNLLATGILLCNFTLTLDFWCARRWLVALDNVLLNMLEQH